MDKSLIPFGSASLTNSYNDLIQEIFQSVWDDPGFLTQRNWRPTEIRQDERNFYVEVELPRFKKDQVKVEIKDKAVLVTAKNDKSSYVRTFSDSRFDVEKVDGRLEDGVLYLTIPKTLQAQSKEIKLR